LKDFIEPEILDVNVFEKRSTAPRRGQNGRFAKTAKLRYTKNPSFKNMISSYFDPSEEAERFHVGIGKKVGLLEKVGLMACYITSTGCKAVSRR
jgi:hypothetical protein